MTACPEIVFVRSTMLSYISVRGTRVMLMHLRGLKEEVTCCS